MSSQYRASLARFSCLALLTVAACTTPLPKGAGQPPRETYRVDGCTLAPDLDFAACCDAHDATYWSGGSCEERRAADTEMRDCIAATGRPLVARLYYLGVRIGGSPRWPFPWRWGFGWPYGTGYSEACD